MNWVCPFCDRPQILQDEQAFSDLLEIKVASSRFVRPTVRVRAKACSNPTCRELTLEVVLGANENPPPKRAMTFPLETYTLRPIANCRPQPVYIKDPIYEDYREACLIRTLSPKAAATLVRRCLQGMVRDFCGISKNRLIDELTALKTAHDEGKAPSGVSAESINAIDHVRTIGNIGAHMEKNVDTVIAVDPDEVDVLIGLVEMLFDEWYGARFSREQRFAQLKAIAEAKKPASAIAAPLEALPAPRAE